MIKTKVEWINPIRFNDLQHPTDSLARLVQIRAYPMIGDNWLSFDDLTPLRDEERDRMGANLINYLVCDLKPIDYPSLSQYILSMSANKSKVSLTVKGKGIDTPNEDSGEENTTDFTAKIKGLLFANPMDSFRQRTLSIIMSVEEASTYLD